MDEEQHKLSTDVKIRPTWLSPLRISSICLGVLIIMFIWFPKRRNINIEHQNLIVSQNEDIACECSLSEPTFQSRYV